MADGLTCWSSIVLASIPLDIVLTRADDLSPLDLNFQTPRPRKEIICCQFTSVSYTSSNSPKFKCLAASDYTPTYLRVRRRIYYNNIMYKYCYYILLCVYNIIFHVWPTFFPPILFFRGIRGIMYAYLYYILLLYLYYNIIIHWLYISMPPPPSLSAHAARAHNIIYVTMRIERTLYRLFFFPIKKPTRLIMHNRKARSRCYILVHMYYYIAACMHIYYYYYYYY